MRIPLILSLAILHSASSSSADVIRVPEDFSTIFSAVDAAAAGDSVLVGPGTWSEVDTRLVSNNGFPGMFTAIAFLKGGVALIGTSGAAATILEGPQPFTSNQMNLMAPDGAGCAEIFVQGFTVRKARHGIHVVDCAPITIRDCEVTDNDVNLWIDGVVLKVYDSAIRRGNVTNKPNILASGLDALSCWVHLERVLFEENLRCVSSESGNGPATVRDCRFVRNTGTSALSLEDHPFFILVEGNVFLENTTNGGPGAALRTINCDGMVHYNTFINNEAGGTTGEGVAVLSDFHGNIEFNTFYGSKAAGFASALWVANYPGHPFFLYSNIFANSSGAPAVAVEGSYIPSEGCNVFWNNAAGHSNKYALQPTDVIADPQFCAPDAFDLTVNANSPCTPPNTAGCPYQIGAWGVGCGGISVDDTSWGRIKALYRSEE